MMLMIIFEQNFLLEVISNIKNKNLVGGTDFYIALKKAVLAISW